MRGFAEEVEALTPSETVARDLSSAIAAGQVELHYQPQVELAGGTVVGLESLSRWTHAGLGVVAPSHFVAVAESTGTIHDLGRWALAEACRVAARWRDQGFDVEIAVNVSPVQLSRRSFFEELERLLCDTGLAAEALTLEITEGRKIRDKTVAIARLDIIADWGVTVSIDDYGSGRSSLGRAAALHAGELKIDRALIAGLDHDRVAHAVAVAHDNGMRVVAEGVESRIHYDFARATGCDRAQGYYITRPIARESCGRWMAAHPGDWRAAPEHR